MRAANRRDAAGSQEAALGWSASHWCQLRLFQSPVPVHSARLHIFLAAGVVLLAASDFIPPSLWLGVRANPKFD